MSKNVLSVNDLWVQFPGRSGASIKAVKGVSFDVARGEFVGVLGESGSGKSTLARALLQVVPKTGHISQGSIELDGESLIGLDDRALEKIRGAKIALVAQDPGIALNPVMKVGSQIVEVLHAHSDLGWNECRQKAQEWVEKVRLTPAEQYYNAYPHQLSGGQQQRVVIAQALASRPSVVIADEPTASLDAATEAEILALLRELREETEASLLLITHNPRLLVGLVDRVMVMYAGRIVEDGPLEKVYREPLHPYTRGLLACLETVEGSQSQKRLATIPGSPPDAESVITGCAFAPRCEKHTEICFAQQPNRVTIEDHQRVECVLYEH